MMDLERHNHRQIEQLNQRGGRTLTIVELIRDGTLSVPMAAYALRAMERGASLLTAARPGGAGKTTLMASILHLLPPGVRIVTVDGPEVLRSALGADEALGADKALGADEALGEGLPTPPTRRPQVSGIVEGPAAESDDSEGPGDLRSGSRRGQETRAERRGEETRAEHPTRADRRVPSPPAPLPERERGELRCYLVHEIGAGHWVSVAHRPFAAHRLVPPRRHARRTDRDPRCPAAGRAAQGPCPGRADPVHALRRKVLAFFGPPGP